MSITWGQHVLSMPYDVTLFQNLLLHSLESRDQPCDYAITLWLAVTVWLINPNPSCSKNRKIKMKMKRKIKMKRENKIKSTVNDLDIPLGTSFDYVIETSCTQTITILYIYFYVWKLDFRFNNINYHPSFISYHYWHLYWSLSSLSSLLNFWITFKPLRVYPRFRYHK